MSSSPKRPRVSVIAALAKNRVIGIENRLPWRLPEDLAHFKALTLNHPILMGRKTFESLGRPLPGRTNIVITRNPNYCKDGCLVAASIPAALALCAEADEVFFIGGAELYAQAIPLADRLYLTEVDIEAEGDAWFPDYDRSAFREVSRESHTGEKGDVLGFDFVVYERAVKIVSEPDADLVNRYATSGHKKIDGWLEQIAVDAIVKISRLQHANGVRGPACEIGVHHGRLFILLHLLTASDERSVSYDLFDNQAENVDGSGRGNRNMLQDNLRATGCDVSRIGIHAANSLDLTPECILGATKGGVRLFSVDGGHTPEITYNDLSLASQSLCEGGVIILDDFFNESWPGVAEGTCKFFLDNPERMVPVAIVGNKFIFTTGEAAAQAYIQELKAGSGPVFKHASAFFGHAVLVITPETRSGLMRSLSQSWLWCALRDTRLGRGLKQNVFNRLRA